jgi:enoyl-CoA hydratase/carnithine racemase
VSFTQILHEVAYGVATITLNRPAKHNAWTQTMEREVRSALLTSCADDRVAAIVVTGAGRGFCSGADMQGLDLAANTDTDMRELLRYPSAQATGMEANYDKRFSYMLRIPKPIVAAVNGPCVGVAFCFVLYCDMRFMAENARMTTLFARRGLIAEHGAAWMLPRLIGPMNALTLLFSGDFVDADEAERMGLVRRLPASDFLAAVQARARALAQHSSPRSIAIMKRQVYDGLFQALGEAADQSDDAMFESFASEDFKEGVAHFVEKRAPRFSGR